MPNEGWVKFLSPRNTVGVLQGKGMAVMSQTFVVNGDYDSVVKKYIIKSIKCFHTAHPKCPEASTCQVVLKNVTDAMF